MERLSLLEVASFYMEAKQTEATGMLPYKTQEDKTEKRWVFFLFLVQRMFPRPEITKSILCRMEKDIITSLTRQLDIRQTADWFP